MRPGDLLGLVYLGNQTTSGFELNAAPWPVPCDLLIYACNFTEITKSGQFGAAR